MTYYKWGDLLTYECYSPGVFRAITVSIPVVLTVHIYVSRNTYVYVHNHTHLYCRDVVSLCCCSFIVLKHVTCDFTYISLGSTDRCSTDLDHPQYVMKIPSPEYSLILNTPIQWSQWNVEIPC